MATELTYSSIKIAHSVRQFEEKRAKERKKNLILLIRHFLREEGYNETAKQFESEASVPEHFMVCDNIDLTTILQEFESYYFLRFQKYPKICKKDSTQTEIKKVNKRTLELNGDQSEKDKSKSLTKASNKNSVQEKNAANNIKGKKDFSVELDLQVLPISACPNQNLLEQSQLSLDFPNEKLLKPLSNFQGYNDEWKIFHEVIAKEVLSHELNVKWDDIIGLEDAKRLLKESVVYPTKYPLLFKGILEPWKALLLYGPPGTGKTLLAKAVATECNTTFFNISASTVVSKWRGDSEKLVRVIFEMARHHAPSTIFFDEIDSLASHRDVATEHEASRRMKSELLIQLDGLSHSNDRVFLLATSNLPWELDTAMLRRLEKRILVDVPSEQARKKMFEQYLPHLVIEKPALTSDLDYNVLSSKTEGYSGSDIKLVCKEAAMQALRQVFDDLEKPQLDKELKNLMLETITTDNVTEALMKTKPLGTTTLSKYRKWETEFGSS